MKTPTSVSLAAWFAFTGVTGASPLDGAGSLAQVTLPYSEVKALLQAAEPKSEQPPPVAAAIASANISFSLDGAQPAATATFEVDVFASGWQLVPLLGTPFVLKTISAPGATVLMKNGMLCLMARQPGHISVKLAFEIPAALVQPGAAPVLLQITAAAAGQLSIASLPSHVHASLEDGSLQSTIGLLPMPADGGEVTLRLTEDKPVVPTQWTSDTEAVIVQHDDCLQVLCRIHLTGDAGSGLTAGLDLPPSAMDVHVSGPDLSQANVKPGRDASLAWKTAEVLDREIRVELELPAPPPGEPWSIRIPRVAGATRTIARTILIPQPGTVLSSKTGHGMDDSKSLPSWLDPSISAAGAIEVASADPFVVEARVLPRLKADTARIPKAEFHTRLVPDGAQLCQARIALQHRGPLRWRFSLPQNSDLLSCEVDGHAVNPLVLGGSLLEIAIEGDPALDASSCVSLSYTARGAAFAPVEGKLALVLPSTPLFIEELTWGLALPDGYESTAFEGNVEPAGGDAGVNFRRQLVRNDAASVEIYYRKLETSR